MNEGVAERFINSPFIAADKDDDNKDEEIIIKEKNLYSHHNPLFQLKGEAEPKNEKKKKKKKKKNNS